MSAYAIITSGKPRGFTVTDAAGQVLATMRQPKYFSHGTEGSAGSLKLRIAPEGMWGMRFGVFLDGTRLGTIKTTAWSQLQWTLTLPDKPMVELQFVSAPWRHRYYLRLAKDLPLLELRPKFRWATLGTDYVVQVIGAGIAPEQMPLILALAGFSARLKRARAHASGGG